MIVLVKLIGVFIACMGLIIFSNPELMKKMISYWRNGNRLYIGGLLRVIFGVIFLFSAFRARSPAFMAALGIFLVIAGMLIFVLGLEKIKKMLDWWDEKPFSVLRLVSIIIFAIGVLIIYSA